MTRGLWLRGRSLPLHAGGFALAFSVLRACRGFPRAWLTVDATLRMSLSAGCAVDGYRMKFDPCGFGSVLRPSPLASCPFWTQFSVTLWPTISLVNLVTCHDGSRVTSLSLSIGSFAQWITSVRLGRCLLGNPCLRLRTRSPRGRLTLSTEREGITPSCQTV